MHHTIQELEDKLSARKGTCVSCPFNDGFTFSASEAQNLGCLPTPYDIIQMKKSSGQNWACHDDETTLCAGLCHQAKEANLDLTQGGLIRYSSWYHAGQNEAIEEARSGYLHQVFTGPYFDMAVSGYRYANGSLSVPTHHHPQLKYYFERSAFEALRNKNDTRVFFSVSTAPEVCPERGQALRTFVALAEVQTSPHDETELWLKYITVHPLHQRKGFGRQLVRQIVAHVEKTKQRLQVSFASEESKLKGFQAVLQEELDAGEIAWSQSR